MANQREITLPIELLDHHKRKINCLPASGEFTIGKQKYIYVPGEDFGALDWGRSNWTFRNRWYWGSASTRIGSRTVGWNIGYGFSDRTPTSENMIFVDRTAATNSVHHAQAENCFNTSAAHRLPAP